MADFSASIVLGVTPMARRRLQTPGACEWVSWYLRYLLSYRDIEELFLERGLEVDHSTLNRRVLA